MTGHRDVQKDFQGINGHGFDDSTQLPDKTSYKSGHQSG